MSLDDKICLWINGWPEFLSPFITFFSVALNYLAIKVVFGIVLVAMLWSGPKSRAAALLAILALAMANGCTDLFKHLLPMHRPFQPQALGALIHLRVGASPSMGTASAHAANMAALATVTTRMLGRWGWPWVFIAVVTGVSRVYTGAHFPYQVLLGWGCGFFTGTLVVWAYLKWTARGESAKTN